MLATEKQVKAAQEYALRFHLYFDALPDYDSTIDLLNEGKFPEEASPLDMFEYSDAEDIASAIETMCDDIISIVEWEET